MAFLGQDDKQQDPSQQNPAQGAGQSSSGPAQVGASGGSDVGSGVSTAGVGAGGTGGWTNIQAYLNANKDSGGSANALNSQIGGAFDKEQNNLQSSANDTKSQAQSQVDKNNIGTSEAANLVAGKANDPSTVSRVNQAVNAQYQGPTSWGYGMSGQAQNYGQGVSGDDNAFQGLMNNFYNDAAGGHLNSGQAALQNQFDVNNPALQAARQNLSSRYEALKNMASSTGQDVSNSIKSAQSAVGTNRDALRGYLTDQATGYQNDLKNLNAAPAAPVSDKVEDPRNADIDRYNLIQQYLGLGGMIPNVGQAPAPVGGSKSDILGNVGSNDATMTMPAYYGGNGARISK